MEQVRIRAAERPSILYWTLLWASGVVFVLLAALHDFLSPADLTPPGRDFANLYAAGKLMLSGEASQAFHVESFRLAILRATDTLTVQNYSYPPHALFIAAPFALLPYPAAFLAWSIAGALFFYWAAKPSVSFAPWLAVLTPAAMLNFWTGHYGFLLGGLWLLYFRFLSSRPVLAGFVASALTFKPHMGLFVGLSALSSPKALVSAIAGTVALFALSAWAFGMDCWALFFSNTFATQVAILAGQSADFYFHLMPSAYVAFGRNAVSVVLHLTFAAAAICILIRYRRIDPFVLATATFIVIPYVFAYDMTVACLGFAVMLWRQWPALSQPHRLILSAALVSPILTIVLAPLVPPILLAALYVQTRGAPHESLAFEE